MKQSCSSLLDKIKKDGWDVQADIYVHTICHIRGNNNHKEPLNFKSLSNGINILNASINSYLKHINPLKIISNSNEVFLREKNLPFPTLIITKDDKIIEISWGSCLSRKMSISFAWNAILLDKNLSIICPDEKSDWPIMFYYEGKEHEKISDYEEVIDADYRNIDLL